MSKDDHEERELEVGIDRDTGKESEMGEVSEGNEPAEQKQEQEEDEEEEKIKGREKTERSPKKTHFKSPPAASSAASPAAPDDEKGLQQSTTVFVFWAYVVAFVSLLTLSLILISSLMPPDEETEFFSMPPAVRHHFSKGKLLKIDVGKDRRPLKVFAIEEGPLTNSECVLLLHGLGASSFTYRHVISSLASRGLHVIALDFPGAGLSEKPFVDQGGMLSKLKEIYREISEKGLFWRFEQMFETGAFPDPPLSSNEVGVYYDAEDLSESIAQVVSLLASSPVHIVLHDTSAEAGLTWAMRNPSLVRSVMLIDAYPGFPSFPAGLLGILGLGFMIPRSSILHQMLLRRCCVTQLTQVEAGYHAFLLRNNGGKLATLRTWEVANTTFDVVSSIGKLGELPLHIVWSNGSGKGWQELGDWLVSQLSGASHTSHSGGRWPQEDAALEITEDIYRFIASLPRTVHSFKADPAPQHTQGTFTGSSDVYYGNLGHNFHTCDHGHGDHEHEHGHGHQHDTHNQGHVHDHGLGYMDNMGHGGWVL